MKNQDHPSSYFNDREMAAFWFLREFIIVSGGGGGSISLFILTKIDCGPSKFSE